MQIVFLNYSLRRTAFRSCEKRFRLRKANSGPHYHGKGYQKKTIKQHCPCFFLCVSCCACDESAVARARYCELIKPQVCGISLAAMQCNVNLQVNNDWREACTALYVCVIIFVEQLLHKWSQPPIHKIIVLLSRQQNLFVKLAQKSYFLFTLMIVHKSPITRARNQQRL